MKPVWNSERAATGWVLRRNRKPNTPRLMRKLDRLVQTSWQSKLHPGSPSSIVGKTLREAILELRYEARKPETHNFWCQKQLPKCSQKWCSMLQPIPDISNRWQDSQRNHTRIEIGIVQIPLIIVVISCWGITIISNTTYHSRNLMLRYNHNIIAVISCWDITTILPYFQATSEKVHHPQIYQPATIWSRYENWEKAAIHLESKYSPTRRKKSQR